MLIERIRCFHKKVICRRSYKETEGRKKRIKAASGMEQPLFLQGTGPEKIKVVVVTTEEKKRVLTVGDKTIEIADYKTKSSADGVMELYITIKGKAIFTELSAISKK